MTNEQIIKDFTEVVEFYREKGGKDTFNVLKNTLDLINDTQKKNDRQYALIKALQLEREQTINGIIEVQQAALNARAEIERLKRENLILSQNRVTFPERIRLVNNTRIKTIEEVQEKLLKKIFPYDHPDKKNYSINAYAVYVAIINTTKEMEGEQQ